MRFFSFDVFDTLLTRLVLKPKDVFYLLPQRLAESGNGLPVKLRDHFWAERVWAEFLAARKEGTDALTLETIYAYLGERWELSTATRGRLVEAEIRLEDELLVPVRGGRAMVAKARQRGRVVFLSDMYLPESFIASKLERLGIRKAGEKVFVSGCWGVTKRSGALYRQALAELAIPPDALTHVGDHPRDDARTPARLGIRVAETSGGRTGSGWQRKLAYAGELLLALRGLARD
ncbi:MAG: hypothetical protein Kow00100_10960 [Geothermobacteraceae bacterium]